MLQNAHNEIFDFLVDEAVCSVHFITHYGNESSHRFCKRQSAVFALTGYAMLYLAKPTSAMLQVFFSGNYFCLLVSGCGIIRNLNKILISIGCDCFFLLTDLSPVCTALSYCTAFD